jgi:CRISPR/Cas system-associated exonuclease Cas4 (RecB family)
MEVEHLSASQLNTLRECPRRWWYYATGAEEREMDNRYADCGSAVHEAIEKHIGGEHPDHGALTADLDDEMYDRYKRCYEKYLAIRCFLSLDHAEAEKELDCQVNGIRLMGRLDVVDGDTVIDWKTGKPSEGERYQAAVYQHLMRENGAVAPRVLFIYLQTGEVSAAPDYPVDYVPTIVEKALATIRSEEYPATGVGCHWCRYAHICGVSR